MQHNKSRGNKTPRGNVTSQSNVANNTKTKSKPPQLSSNGQRTVVSHREVTMEALPNSTVYTIEGRYAVQPAISSYSKGSPLGAWLPKIAKEYDNYEFDMLKFHFITTCSTLTNGMVIMSYDPNPDAQPPLSFADARSSALCATGPARQSLVLDLTSKVKGRKLLTREGAVTAYPNYDAGQVFVATNLGDNTNTIGYIEVEYRIALSNPQVSPSLGGAFGVSQLQPVCAFIGSTDTTARYLGKVNTGRNLTRLTSSFLAGASSRYGNDSIVTFNTSPNRTNYLSWVSPNSNITYSCGNAPIYYFNLTLPGRYRLYGMINAQFQDFVTYGAEVVRWDGNLLQGNPSAVLDVALDKFGNTIGVPARACATRGFKTTDIVGAQDNCEVPWQIDITFVVGDVTKPHSLVGGVRDVGIITQNDDALYQYATGNGFSQLYLEYLGDCAAPASAYGPL